MSNNFIKLKGRLSLDIVRTYECHGEIFSVCKIEVARKSETFDILPLTISNRLGKFENGQFLEVNGEFRTRNEFQDGKSRLIITVFAKDVRLLECEEYENSVELNGFICKQPIIRETPLTNRIVADILFAVNGRNNRTSYIPSIAWNRDAQFVSELPVGTEISVSGKLQSRNYQKNIDGQIEERTAIELCIKNLSKIDKGE